MGAAMADPAVEGRLRDGAIEGHDGARGRGMPALDEEAVEVLVADGRVADDELVDAGVGPAALAGRVVLQGHPERLVVYFLQGGGLRAARPRQLAAVGGGDAEVALDEDDVGVAELRQTPIPEGAAGHVHCHVDAGPEVVGNPRGKGEPGEHGQRAPGCGR